MEEDRSYGHVLDKSALYIHHAPRAARHGNGGVMNHARTKGFPPKDTDLVAHRRKGR
jgi:hypothetical protein